MAESTRRRSTDWPGNEKLHSVPYLLLDTQLSGRTVLDKTGLVGKYDVKLRWTPEDMRLQTDAGAGGPDETDVASFIAYRSNWG